MGRRLLAVTILGSGIAFLDGTVVNVAIPAIGRDLSAGFSGLQWVVDGYLLTLGSLVLLGGSLGDILGLRRTFLGGVIAFGVASAACALAPTTLALVIGRAVQGVAAALLVPGSLAILSATFHGEERGRPIGAWSGLAGVSTAVGPFLGGILVDHGSWRLVFLINAPLVVATVWLGWSSLPRDVRRTTGTQRIDLAGGICCTAGLGLLVVGLIDGPRAGFGAPSTIGALAGGAGLLLAFLVQESRSEQPMLPLGLFHSRNFTIANLCTLAVYGALSAALFLVVLELQSVVGYSALAAGASLTPITLLMLLLSSRMGRLTGTLGPRPLMTAGPLIGAAGMLLFARIGPGVSYVDAVLPGAIVFGIGLSLTVAPLTTTVLSAVPAGRSGVASGVNNAVARIGGLIAVAAVPLAAGLAAPSMSHTEFTDGFHRAMVISAVLCAIGGLVAWVGLRNLPARAPAPVGGA